jgi:DNA repair exonuclease SbcCD ATPase subunit
MSESPRWERESQEPLGSPAPAPQPDETVEFDLAAAGLVDTEEERRTRLAGARESLAGSLSASRESLAGSLSTSRESLTATRESLSTTAGKVGRWFASLDRRPEFDAHVRRDPLAELNPGPDMPAAQDLPAADDVPAADELAPPPEYSMPQAALQRNDDDHEDDGRGRFPTAALGYSRQAVDRHVAELEAEVRRLRDRVGEPVSITEEIERLGEQTASILVVAHDKAHETARRAEQHAAQAVTDAARDAERITGEAERRLRELDEETDAVWRERERLLEDVRVVSRTLATLADDAAERFPAAEPTSAIAMAEPTPAG